MALNWRALRVIGGVRSAIYDEAFPADLASALRPFPEEVAAAFNQEVALAVLVTFATGSEEPRERAVRTLPTFSTKVGTWRTHAMVS